MTHATEFENRIMDARKADALRGVCPCSICNATEMATCPTCDERGYVRTEWTCAVCGDRSVSVEKEVTEYEAVGLCLTCGCIELERDRETCPDCKGDGVVKRSSLEHRS